VRLVAAHFRAEIQSSLSRSVFSTPFFGFFFFSARGDQASLAEGYAQRPSSFFQISFPPPLRWPRSHGHVSPTWIKRARNGRVPPEARHSHEYFGREKGPFSNWSLFPLLFIPFRFAIACPPISGSPQPFFFFFPRGVSFFGGRPTSLRLENHPRRFTRGPSFSYIRRMMCKAQNLPSGSTILPPPYCLGRFFSPCSPGAYC